MDACPTPGELVEARMDRVLTQYRESPKLLALIRHSLEQLEQAALTACDIPNHFDIRTAIGDQLTLIGKRMGWPRCHCVCTVEPVFGFDCDAPNPNLAISGFCEPGSSWIDCRPAGTSDLCLYDDGVYRGYLYARRYQMMQLYDIDSLQAALGHIWGPTAVVHSSGGGRVTIAPGRALTTQETRELPVAVRVLPIAPGIGVNLHLGAGNIFGFGGGWGGFCETTQTTTLHDSTGYLLTGVPVGGATTTAPADANWLCGTPYDAYACV